MCSGNSRCSSVCLLARIEWNNRVQPETPARRKSRVITVRKFEFFQPMTAFAATFYWGFGITKSYTCRASHPEQVAGFGSDRHVDLT